jgi:hypothetical protein
MTEIRRLYNRSSFQNTAMENTKIVHGINLFERLACTMCHNICSHMTLSRSEEAFIVWLNNSFIFALPFFNQTFENRTAESVAPLFSSQHLVPVDG